MRLAFVPDKENLNIDEVKETLYSKFGFLESIEEISTEFHNVFNKEENCPNFNITLPSFLGGATVNPIDLTFFNQYRTLIHGFIIATSYFFFIKKLSHKVPNLIKGE